VTSRVALVTGGNRGIGKAVVEAFRSAGYRVVATHRGEPPPDLPAVRCDVTDAASVDAAFDWAERAVGPVDVLVANAGITKDALLMRMSEDAFQQVVDTNLTGAWRCAKRALPGMLRRRWGRIILISSVAGLSGSGGQTNYAASKSGLVGLARSIARETGARGITANVVAPGAIETDMIADLPETVRNRQITMTPLGRVGRCDEVADAAVWLAGERAAFVTGAVIPVDGGLGMGH
jgi:NAD(P)-dependent dehydrogenase (short-subunit alcohol dehydrogenase family)